MSFRYDTVAPDRNVTAMDPSPFQVYRMRKTFAPKLPNLKVVRAGIGKELGTGIATEEFTGMESGDKFRVETLDHLYFEQGRKLGFAHIDVEGLELDVLQGGLQTIQDSNPIFTVEVRVHKNATFTSNLLNYIDEVLAYDAYVIDEPCGYPHMDYRSLICFPRKWNTKLIFSDIFNLASATEAIFRVNAQTIFAKVYPQCALGQELCQTQNTTDATCCGESLVRKWHDQTCPKPISMQGFTYSKKAVLGLWRDLEKRAP